MKYIGHLDTQRYFQKLNRRAGIDVAYSEGYSPHQKMSFAQPLSVGVESEGEYFDLEIRSAYSSERLLSQYASCETEGIRVKDLVLLPGNAENAMASVRAADYEVRFRTGQECPFDLKEALEEYAEAESWIMQKETKKGSREIDLKELVNSFSLSGEGVLSLRLCAESGSNVKPGQFIGSLYERKGFAFDPFCLLITRMELLGKDLRPLIEAGEHFS